jgi:hypothetical protein
MKNEKRYQKKNGGIENEDGEEEPKEDENAVA